MSKKYLFVGVVCIAIALLCIAALATALYPDKVESGYSNEVSKLIPVVGVPGTLRITGVKVEGQLNFEIDQ